MEQSTMPHNYTRPFEVERLRIVNRCVERIPSKGKSLIEFGCNAGEMTRQFAGVFDNVLAIEYDADLLRQAAENANCSNVEWLQYDLNNTIFDRYEGEFDAAIALEIIEHLRSPEAFLRQIKRCLRPGGSLLISAPNMRSPEAFTGSFFDARDGLNYNAWDESHISLFNASHLIAMLKRSGFSVSRVTGYYYGFILPRTRRKVRLHWSTSLWPLNRLGFNVIVEANVRA